MWRLGWPAMSYLLRGIPLLLVCLLVILVSLPWWLRPLLNQGLPAATRALTGLELLIDIDHLSWQQLHIRHAHLRLADGSEAELEQLQLNFPGVWATDNPGSLDLPRLRLTLNQQGSQLAVAGARQASRTASARLETAITQQQPLSLPQLQDWLTLPLSSIRIHELHIEHPWFDARLASELDTRRWRLHGEIQLTGVDQPWQLESQLSQSGQLLLQLSEQQTLLAQLYADIQQAERNTHINLRQQLELAALYPRLQQAASAGLPIPADLPIPAPQLISDLKLHIPDQALLPQDLYLSSSTRLPLNSSGSAYWQQLQGELTLQLDHPDRNGWQWQLDSRALQLDYPLGESNLVSIQTDQLVLAGQCDDPLQQCGFQLEGQLQLRQQEQQLTLTPALQGQWQDNRLQLNATPTASLKTAYGPVTLNSQLDFEWQAEHSRLAIQQLSARWQPDRRLRQQTGWSSEALQIHLQEAASLTLIPHPQLGYRIEAAPWKIITDPLRLTRNKDYIQLGGGSLECQPSLQNPHCQLDIRLRESRLDPWPLPAGRLSGPLRYQASQQQLEADLQLQAASQQLQLRSRLQHNLETGNGSAQWHLDRFNLNWQAMGLTSMENLTGVQLLAGQLSGQGWLDWNTEGQMHPDMMLRADDISLIWNNSVSIEGWDFLLALRQPPGNQSGYTADAQLTVDSINNGIRFSNILTRARLQLPADLAWYQLDLQEIHTDVLGGRIHIPSARYDSREPVNAFNVNINNLQLAEMAALEPSAEVQANGTMDGLLPVVITQAGLSVPDGTLFARSPGGSIRYHNDTSINLSNADPTVGLAMQALKNFQFRELGSTINYQPDGGLHLAMKFEGKNPDFFGGQSTNLNINLDYNLLDLLESLRVADDIISRVEKKYGQ